MSDYKKLIQDLVKDSNFYEQWNESATDTQFDMLWKSIWDHAAEHHGNNDFVQGVYDYFQINGHLTYKQFYYLIRQLYPSIMPRLSSLRDRI